MQDQPKSGRPLKATAEYCRLLDEALSSDPASYGYVFTIWTTDCLRQYREQRTGICRSRARFAELLEREGYVFRRPKKDQQPKQSQTAKQQATELLDELKRGRTWRFRASLCGRNNLEPELSNRQLLDDTGAAKNHPCFQWQAALSACRGRV